MKDKDKTKEQLIKELIELRRQIIEFKAAEAGRKQAGDLQRIQRDVAISLGSTSVLTDVLDQILEAVFQIKGIDCGGVHLVDKVKGDFHFIAHKRLPRRFLDNAAHYTADSPQAHQIKKMKPIYGHYPDIFLFSGELFKHDGIRGATIIPVQHKGQLVAVLNLASHIYDEIPANARTGLEAIAAQIGGVIARVRVEEEREKLIIELKEALDKVSTLSGLLPICANCKRIRDDRGYWHQVEKYLSDHAEVLFSHGLCEDCVKKLYPDLFSEEEKDS
ncbi:hypothetical protein ES703_93209 [subsurface metagenome]